MHNEGKAQTTPLLVLYMMGAESQNVSFVLCPFAYTVCCRPSSLPPARTQHRDGSHTGTSCCVAFTHASYCNKCKADRRTDRLIRLPVLPVMYFLINMTVLRKNSIVDII